MLITPITRQSLAIRRQRRDLRAKGYEEISCASGIGRLWELDRGGRIGWRIVDAVVGLDARSVFVRAEPPQSLGAGQ